MGMYGSSTTSSTSIPKPSAEEMGLINLMQDGLMTSFLDDAGYEVTKTQSKWEDSNQYKDFQQQKETINSQITALTNSLSTPQEGQRSTQVQNQIANLQFQLQQVGQQQNSAAQKFQPDINYTSRKKDDMQTEAIRQKYGADSEEYKAAKENYQTNQLAMEAQKSQIDVLTMNAAEKFLKGDYSLNDSQKQFISDTLGPVRDAGLKAVDYLKQEAGLTEGKLQSAADDIKGEILNTDKALKAGVSEYKSAVQDTADNLNAKLTDFTNQVKQTGMDMGDAILELENRTKQTGVDMKQALDQSIALSKSMTEMGIQDFSLETRNKVATQAASLGRSPTDPEFIKQMQTAVNRQITETGLQFGQMAAQGQMNIAQQTGQGMEEAAKLRLSTAERTGQGLEEAARTGMSIEQQRGQGMESAAQMGLSVAERTGQGLEGVANTRLGIAERTGGINEEAARLRGQVGVGYAESVANMGTQIGMNQAPSTIGLGFNVGQYNQAIEQTRLANAQAAMNAPAPLINWYQGDRRAQPTTTQETSQGFGSVLGGLIGTGLSAAGTAGKLGWKPFG